MGKILDYYEEKLQEMFGDIVEKEILNEKRPNADGNLKKFFDKFPEGEIVKDGKECSIKISDDIDNLVITQEDLNKIYGIVVKEGVWKHKVLMSDLFDFSHLPFLNIIFQYHFEDGGEEKIEYHTNIERKELTATLFQRKSDFPRLLFMYRYRWTINNVMNEEANIDANDQLLDVSQYCDVDKLYEHVDEDAARYIDMAMWRFFYINYFVRAVPTSYTVIDKPVSKTIATGKGKNKKYKHVTKIVHEYTINIKHRTKQELKRCITCPAWGVRGHFRTITNPKTGVVSQVFVRPYVKGKERHNAGAYVAKDYEV